MKIISFIVFLILNSCITYSQSDSDDIDLHLQLLTTIVRSEFPNSVSQGSGFYYGILDSNKTGNWRQVKQTWLITNRHLVFVKNNSGKEILPELFTFYLRRIENQNLQWAPIHISKSELRKILHVFSDSSIDIAAINVSDLLMNEIKTVPNIAQYRFVTDSDLPGDESKLYSHVTDDVIVIGYPEEFYDDVHLFPVVKAGIIASRWGVGFRNKPYFLIDSKLYSGSSGSIVISKPTNLTLSHGHQYYSLTKQFSFLGIYSGEQQIIRQDEKISLNLGIVWYSQLIHDLTQN
jgi:hypothetical protein